MVALLVFATILVFIGIEFIRRHSTKSAHVPAPVAADGSVKIPKGYLISKSHLWIEMLANGEARIGVDDFVQKITGAIDHIGVARFGSEIKKGEALFTLHNHKRTLTIPAPISGTVLKINDALLSSPQMLQNDPYIAGWVAVVAPSNISHELSLLSAAEDAAKWMRKEIARFRDFIRAQSQIGMPSAVGATLLDGGMPLNNVLEQFNENTWNAFQKEFLRTE